MYTGRFSPNQPSVFLSGSAVLPLQHRRHTVQLDGRYFRDVLIAGLGQRPSVVLPFVVQQQRVLRAHRVAAKLDSSRRRHHRPFRRAPRRPLPTAPIVPIVRHGHGHQRRDVLQPGDRGKGGLLELETGIRAGHAGRASQRSDIGEFPQRLEGGQRTGAEHLDAQQCVAQVSVRQDEPDRDQLQNNDGVHGQRDQRYDLRINKTNIDIYVCMCVYIVESHTFEVLQLPKI